MDAANRLESIPAGFERSEAISMANVRDRGVILILPLLLMVLAVSTCAQGAVVVRAGGGGNALAAPESAAVTAWGTVPIGQSSSTLAVTLSFADGGTLATSVALTQGAQNKDFSLVPGGSCTVGQSYQAGASCSVNATFTPLSAGLRMGAIVLADETGKALATAYISGVGTGPQAGFQGLNQPLASLSNLGIVTDKGIAVDGSGDIFVPSVNATTAKESVVEIPAGCVQAACLKQLPGTFFAVWGLAVDGAGNLWVGDEGANGSITEILAAGGYSALKTYSGSFGNQIGVAVDGGGNVYFTGYVNGYSDSVTELTAASGYGSALTLAANINVPGGVAVDANGNVFYIDSWASGIQEIEAVNGSIPASPTVVTVAKGLKGPSYLAVDPSGNLLVTASGGFIYQAMADGGYATVQIYSNQLTAPTGIAEDGSGNLYIEGIQSGINNQGNPSSTSMAYEIQRSPVPSLSFPTPTAPGVTDTADGAQRVSLQNLGNQPLALSGMTLSSGDFTFDKATNTCTASSTLGAGEGCTLGVLFTPTTTGKPLTGTLTLTDNALNGAGVQQSLALTGQGMYTPTISVNANSLLVAVSQDLTLALTVHGGVGNPIPSGTLQVSGSNYTGTPAMLSNGQATLTVPAGSLPLGQNTLNIQYQPDSASAAIYVSVQAQASVTVTRTLMSMPSVAVTPAVNSISVGQALTVVVAVSSQVNGNPTPTGTVILAGGTYNAAATQLSNGSASFTIPANALFIGGNQLVSNYTPDAGSSNIYVAGRGTGFVLASAAPPPAGAAPEDLGTLGIGKTSAVTAVTLSFPAGGTPASLMATTQGATGLDFALVSGGSCGAGVNVPAGQSCTVNATFTPGYAGLRSGAVLALDANGQTLAMTYLHGVGTGAKLDITASPSYWVQLENQYAPRFIASSNTVIGDEFSRPIVTVDGGGNVYVSDWNNNRVQKIPAGCTQTSCAVTVMNGLFAPTGVAVDGAGNLFVSEQGYGDVKKIPVGCQSPSCMQTIGTGFNAPYGLYVDASGNVFVADTFNNAVKEVVAAGGYATINTLASGLDLPWSVVVNAAGDLFVAEGGDQCQPWIPGSCLTINTSLLQIPAAGGYKTVNTLSAGGFGKPFGLAIDSAGNVYESDYGNGCSWEWTAGSGYATTETWCTSNFGFMGSEGLGVESNGDLFFADVNSGTVYQTVFNAQPAIHFRTAILAGGADYQDGAQSIFLMNNGNAALTLSGMTLSDAAIQFDKTYTTCATAKPILAGGQCFIAVDFAPATGGPHNATLTLTGGDGNGSSTWTIPITATALPPVPTILSNPANPTTTNAAVFTFSDAQSPVTFVCSIDALPFAACSSPQNYSALSGGAHTFQVKAVDTQGNLSLAAVYNWMVNAVGPPAPTITSAPASFGNADTATFVFTDAQAGVTFLCSMDGAAFTACSSGISYSGLSLTGSSYGTKWHSFAVEAKDSAGNVSPEATWSWLISSYDPTGNPVNFGTVPVGQTSAPQTVTFTFGAADTIASINATTMGITGLDYAVSDPGACAVGTAVTKGATCTLKVIFTPKFAGQRKGGVVLLDSTGTGIGEAYLQGTGSAPQVTFTPYSTLWYSDLPPQNNPDPKMNLSSLLTDAAVDGAGNLYVTEADRTNAYANESGSTQAVVVNVGAFWEFPAGCTTPSCMKLLASAEGDGSQYSSNTSVLLPYGVVMDGPGMLWIANLGLGVSRFSTIGSSLSGQCFYVYDSYDSTYMKRVGVDGGGICSFLSYYGGLFVDGAQVGVPGQAAAIGAAAPAIEHKPDAVGGSGYSGPSFDFSSNTSSMTVDPQGNIWVADAGNNAIKEVLASSIYSVDRTVGSGFNNPSGVTSDAFGNIYVADTGNNALKEITAASGYTQVVTIATFDPKVLGLGNFTIDAAGNFYLANSAQVYSNQLAKLDFADAPALNFPTQTLVGAIDSTDGTLTATVKNNGNMPLNIAGLAVSNSNFQIDASATTCSTAAPLAVGASCTVGVFFSPTANGALTGTLTLTDNALNQSAATQSFALSGTGYMTPVTATPSVTVAPASASITTAQSDQVTVTVSGATGKATPTGAVTLSSGNYASSAVPLSAGSAIFTVPAGALALGSDTVVAMYTPDAASATTYGSGAGASTVTVTAAPKSTPTVAVTPSSINISTAQSLPVTITVSGSAGNATPTGSVTVSGGNYSSLAATLTNGSAAFTVPAGSLPAGTVTLSAFYTPDPTGAANFTSASGSSAVAVQAAALVTPVVTVTPASGSIFITQSLQVTMTVAGGSGQSKPTGSVLLSAGNYTAPAAVLSNGSVIVSIPAKTLAAGTATLTATYTPDTASSLTYNGASGSNTVSVSAIATNTALQASTSSPAYGAPVTFTATVTPVSGTVAPTGTVTLMDGATALATGLTLNGSGVASYSTSTLAAGMHSITAVYSGDTGDSASTSPSVTVTVAAAIVSTTTTLQASAASVIVGGSVTFTATVAQVIARSTTASGDVTQANASTVPTGTVTFLDGSATLGSSSLNTSGAATYTTSALALGTHSITASYGGDANNAASVSTAVTVTAANPPTFTLSSSSPAQTVTAGGTATYTLTVTPQNGAFNNTISFSASGLPPGATASFTPATLTPGASAATTQLSITTAPQTGAAKGATWPLAAPVLALAGLLGIPRRRRRFLMWCALFAAALGALTLSGCGGGFALPAMPVQNYTVSLTASGGAVQQTITVQLTVR
jgi:sugar lactone lactonase YvrE